MSWPTNGPTEHELGSGLEKNEQQETGHSDRFFSYKKSGCGVLAVYKKIYTLHIRLKLVEQPWIVAKQLNSSFFL